MSLQYTVGGTLEARVANSETQLFTAKLASHAKSYALMQGRSASYERMYPRVFDPASDLGSARSAIDDALADARASLDQFDTADMGALASSLALVASSLKHAYTSVGGADEIASILNYMRRATLTSNADEVTRGMLNTLISVLRDIRENPLIGYEEAAKFADRLSDQGWRGEERDIALLVESLAEALRQPEKSLLTANEA